MPEQILTESSRNENCASSSGDYDMQETNANVIQNHNQTNGNGFENGDNQTLITMLHFNDCYNIEARATAEPKGGAARFCSAIKSFKDLDPLVLFSGDILGPSILSTFTKGEQMIPVLNYCGVHCAVYGNHDFDYGLDNLLDFVKKTTFPWLMSNVIDNETGRPLGDGQTSHIITKFGKRIGFIGLIEEEWLATLATIDKEDVTYLDFVSEGRKLARHLKERENCDIVIALTHMRTPNDSRLAANVDEIDLILGGHDHEYEVKKVNGKFIVKSGTDFREFSKIDLVIERNNKIDLTIKHVLVNSSDFDEDTELAQELKKYSEVVEAKMDTILGEFHCDLDGRFASIRTGETNLGNFVADIMLASTHSDLAILNSGTLRSDMIHPAGQFKLRDLVTIMPMMDPMIVLSANGEQIWKALENGVSQWPKLEGRFPQVSGVSFAFDPEMPSGQRIDPRFIKIGDEYLDLKQNYRLVTKAYLHQGKDGYDVLKECRVLVDEEECPELCTSIQNHFEAIKILTGSSPHHSRHRQSLVTLSRRTSVVKMHDMGSSMNEINVDAVVPPLPHSSGKGSMKRGMSIDTARKTLTAHAGLCGRLSVDEVELTQCRLEPKLENRIVILTKEILAQLEKQRDEYERLSVGDVIPEEDSEEYPVSP